MDRIERPTSPARVRGHMVRRSPPVLPFLLATVVLCAGALASWLLTRGTTFPLPLAPLGPATVAPPVAATPEPVASGDEEPPIARPDLESESGILATEADVERIPLDAVELADAIWVAGRLLFPAGTPADEKVEIVATGKKLGRGHTYRATVARDGSFRVAFAERTRRGTLRVDAPHLFLEHFTRLDLDALPAELVLEPELGGCLRGVVLPPAGAKSAPDPKRCGDIVLSCETRHGPEDLGRHCPIDASLHFELRGVPAGAVYDLAFDPGCWAPLERHELSVAAGETMELALEAKLGARIRGRVLDEAGTGVKSAYVSVRVGGEDARYEDSDGEISADGAFTIDGVTAGQVLLEAEAEGYLSAELDLGELRDGETREGIELRLQTGGTLAGRVEWPDGSAAAGASLFVEESSVAEGEEQSWRTSSQSLNCEADGSFRISGLRDGTCTLRAEASMPLVAETAADPAAKKPQQRSQSWRAVAKELRPGASGVVLILQPGLSVKGRVVDDTGATVERFTVGASSRDRDEAWSMGANVSSPFRSADGTFELSGLGEGSWEVEIQAKGFVEQAGIYVELPRDADLGVLALSRVATLSGTVVDPAGQVVPRSVVQVRPPDDSRGWWNRPDEYSATTDSQGRFEVDDAPTGKVSLFASREGFAPSSTLEVEVAPAQKLGNITLALRLGGRIDGQLLATEGDHVDGRTVSVRSLKRGEIEDTVTDSSGDFAFEALAPGEYEVTAEASESSDSPREESRFDWMARASRRLSTDATIVDGETTRVILGAPPRAPVLLSGVVRRGTHPVEGAGVTAWGQTDVGEDQLRFAVSNAAGSYQMTLDEPGVWNFSLQGPSGGAQISRSERIPEVASLTLDFELPSGRISGRVLGPDGEPLPRAHVRAEIEPSEAEKRSDGIYGECQSDGEGRFELEDLAAGSYVVVAGGEPTFGRFDQSEKYGEVEQSGLVLPDGGEIRGLELRLEEAATLDGTVRTAAGEPAAGARIAVWGASGEARDDWRTEQADPNGHYVVRGLSTGTWSVSARLGAEVSKPTPPVRLGPGERVALDLELRSGTMLRIFVEDASGKPVGAGISVLDERGLEHGGMRAEGEVAVAAGAPLGSTVGPIAPGTYRVLVFNHDGVSAEQSVVVNGETTLEVRLRLGGNSESSKR
jgi:protocatechuate 3,4-dioxygenase beta subunit